MRHAPKPKTDHSEEARITASERKNSKVNKIFWIIMLFFFISAAAYYLDMWIQG